MTVRMPVKAPQRPAARRRRADPRKGLSLTIGRVEGVGTCRLIVSLNGKDLFALPEASWWEFVEVGNGLWTRHAHLNPDHETGTPAPD